MSDPVRHRVVIVGAGFGGIAAAEALAKAPVDVTVVDRTNHHLFQPLLYQVATASLSPADIAQPIRSILKHQTNARVVLDKVVGVDRARKRVLTRNGAPIAYDTLILATGARHSYFGNDHWSPFAPGLKTIEDATRLRARVLTAFERAEVETDPDRRKAMLTFVVVGGGPTGVEMAGAIAELARHAITRDFRTITPHCARIVLVEAGPRLLATFKEVLSAAARRALEVMGVEVRTGAAVADINAAGVRIGEEHIAAGTVVWAAGVMASPAGKWLGAERDRAGRVKVGADFALPSDPDIFVIGDTAAYADEDGKPLPGIAPAAKQAGAFVGRLIAARVVGAPPPPPFAYRDHGSLATIGRSHAVVDLHRLRLTGFPAWFVWSLAHVYYLVGFQNRVSVAASWFWSYLTWQRGARLITGDGDVHLAPQPEVVR
jgi:NADH dehydrogenase